MSSPLPLIEILKKEGLRLYGGDEAPAGTAHRLRKSVRVAR
jgi:hypothetical protein